MVGKYRVCKDSPAFNVSARLAFCYSLQLIDSCEEKSKCHVPSHPHPEGFNMEPCRTCGKKYRPHKWTGAEKGYNGKKQPPSIAVLWKF